LFIKISKNP